MLGTQYTIMVIICISTLSETNHRARATEEPAPPFPLQGPAGNHAKQHIQAGRNVHVHTSSIKTSNDRPSAQQATGHTAHGGRAFQVLCPSAPHNNLMSGHWPHPTDEETEAQRG